MSDVVYKPNYVQIEDEGIREDVYGYAKLARDEAAHLEKMLSKYDEKEGIDYRKALGDINTARNYLTDLEATLRACYHLQKLKMQRE